MLIKHKPRFRIVLLLAAIIAVSFFVWQQFERPPQLPAAIAVRISWPVGSVASNQESGKVVAKEEPQTRDLLLTATITTTLPGWDLLQQRHPTSIELITAPVYRISRVDGSMKQVDEKEWKACSTSPCEIAWGTSQTRPEFRQGRQLIDDTLSPLLTEPVGGRWYSAANSPDGKLLGMVSAYGNSRKSGGGFPFVERTSRSYEGPFYAEILDAKTKSRLIAFELVGAVPYSNPTGTVWTNGNGWYIVYSTDELFWAIPNPAK